MMSSTTGSCGPHSTLADNEGARVTRCPCGALHVLVKASGVTMQLPEARFQQLGLAVMGAVAALGATSTKTSTAGTPTTPPRTIN